MVVPLRINKFQQCWFLKTHLLNACKIKEFWPLCLQPADLYYILPVFLHWMGKLLNKTDTQNFPQKCLFTLRMTGVFINVWMNMVVLLRKFSWSWYKVGMNWRTSNTSRTFCIEFRERLFAHISSPGSLTDNSMNLGSIKKGFLMVPNFP